ncbi:aminotransferase class V-fold PLP-dependent enzyme [Angustibacter luteus]|uniref:Aminotransferase class V-fold PLP-dependent enzyme n=1 Tax=Angustibacter luteus TaxID=658456 RepID=A0ABW1JBX1_9ACTN
MITHLDVETPTAPTPGGHPAFAPAPGYLNAATLGLPPRATADAVRVEVEAWQRGEACAVAYDAVVNRARALYAALVGVPSSWVATGSQVSVTAGVLAASLPAGSRVVCVDGDFSSMVYPFLVQRSLHVRQVPLEELADAVAEGCDVVAFSLAQSADGRLVDADAVLDAARQVGALTFCDLTQAVGWLAVDAADFDVSVCSAYKWLCSPRGSAFTTVRPEVLERLTPLNAGWYAGESVWGSCYGPQMRLANDARRFDVSPAWLSWVGTVPSLELFASLTPDQLGHGAALADRLRTRLDLAPQGRPVLSLPDADGVLARRLGEAGCTVAGRAGLVRIAFHLWNDEADLQQVGDALSR